MGEVKCPYCNHICSSHDFDIYWEECPNVNVDCISCSRKFEIEAIKNISFFTSKKEEPSHKKDSGVSE